MREPEENYEDEEFEEEEEEEITNEQLLAEYRQEALAIRRELRNCERGTPRYGELARELGDITDSIKALEIAGNERQQKEESIKRSADMASERFFRYASLVTPIIGNIIGTTAAETIRARARHKDIDTITTYEADGNIVKTSAQRLIKP